MPRISLDGTWEFMHVAASAVAKPMQVRSIVVPSPWQAQFDDLRMRGGTGLYRRTFEWSSVGGRPGDRVSLHFGAVFHNTRVWVNEIAVGAHDGGFLPFAFDVTDALKEGSNEIKLRVESPTDDPLEFPETPFAEIPFGKQSWYGPLSGIWQSVFLESRAAEHIARLRIVAEPDGGWVRTRVHFSKPLIDGAVVTAEVVSPSGEIVAAASDNAAPGATETAIEARIAPVAAWSPDEPNLYRLRVRLTRRDAELDAVEESFGFRSIAVRDGRFFLNGQPLYLRGALDQDYYPDTICTVPSIEFLEDQARKAKELGLNCLRCHIKAPDPRYYDVADRFGLLVWTEVPNGEHFTERSRARREALLRGIVDRDFNHPSIICWTLINENWGVDLVHDGEHRAWLRQAYRWLKSYDPTRLVVDNSPVAPSFHVETDIADYHYYAAFPDSRLEWDRFVDDFAARPGWLFSTEGDAVQTGQEPLVCSEFGNWGLPDPARLRGADGREPWWFETGHDWGEGIMYAHGVENRFTDWSLDRVFGSFAAFIEATQRQQFQALKYQIEAMRRHASIAGYVITEFTDTHWESNGLLDMRRNPRVFHDEFRTINADIVIIPRWDRLAYWAGETARFDASIAWGGAAPAPGLKLVTRLEGRETTREVGFGESLGVSHVGEVEMMLPAVKEPLTTRAVFELRSGSGGVLASNHLDLAIHPSRAGAPVDPGPIWSPAPEMRARLSALGYAVVESLAEAALVIAPRLDGELATFVRKGGRLVLLAETEGTLNPLFSHWQNVRVVRRDGTVWRGDWASSFAWLRRGLTFGHLPGGPLLDASFDRVLPTHVITGCNLLDFQGRVYAGLVVGWVHKPVAIMVERPYGRGKFVASTFRLFRDPPGADPTATTLLDGMIRAAAGASRHVQGLAPELAAAS